MVEAGLEAAVLPLMATHPEGHGCIRTARLAASGVTRMIGIVHRHGAAPQPPAARFLEIPLETRQLAPAQGLSVRAWRQASRKP